MGIRFDRSSCTVLAICDCCDWWQLELDEAIARRRALEHAWSVHPSDRTVLNMLQTWRRRAAANS